jgi:integrase
MRKGEIARLTWDAFDRETWTLRLHARDAKTRHGRSLALEGQLKAIIERRLKVRRLSTPLIFHRDGEPVAEFRKAWATACRRAGLPGILFHDLRRSAIRDMVRAGVDPVVATKISGHKTRSTFDRYNITCEEDLRDAMKKTEDHVSALPKERAASPLRKARRDSETLTEH